MTSGWPLIQRLVDGEWRVEVFETGVLQVFLAKDGFFYWYAPVDAEREILDADATIGFGMVEVVALILEDGSFGEYGKAMGKASGDEELKSDD